MLLNFVLNWFIIHSPVKTANYAYKKQTYYREHAAQLCPKLVYNSLSR